VLTLAVLRGTPSPTGSCFHTYINVNVSKGLHGATSKQEFPKPQKTLFFSEKYQKKSVEYLGP